MSGLDGLSERDVDIVRECLTAAVRGPFLPESEFEMLIGLDRDEVAHLLATCPDASNAEDADVVVNNVLNNLLGYPHRKWDAWPAYISAQPADVASVLTRWRGDDEFDREARGYFDRLR